MNTKELKKQLLRFNRARTEKTLLDTLSKIDHWIWDPRFNQETLSKKQKSVFSLIKHTYRVRTPKRWVLLLSHRKKQRLQ